MHALKFTLTLIVQNNKIFAQVFVLVLYDVPSIVYVTNYTYDVDEDLTCLKE